LIVTIVEIHMLIIDVILLKNKLDQTFSYISDYKKLLFKYFKVHGEKYDNHRFYLKFKHAYL